jgi:hypothetical protein
MIHEGLSASERDAKIHRLQRGRIAGPASAIGLLEREGLLDPEPVRNAETIPTSRRWIGLAGGESTIISTSAVTSALCSATSLSISNTRLTLRKSSQVLVASLRAAARRTSEPSH